MARFKLNQTRHPGVYRRANDGRLVVRVSAVSDKTGKLKERMRVLPANTSLHTARTVAEELRQGLRADIETRRPPTLGAYAPRWLKRKIASGDWREGSTSSRTTISVLENHILPTLGDVLIARLTVADLREWMDAQLESGAKASTIRNRWGHCKVLVREACVEHGLPDPTVAVKPPKAKKKGGRDLVLMPAEVRTVLAYTRAKRVPWHPLVLLGFASGARQSELLTARVADFDLQDEVGVWTLSVDAHLRPRI